MNRVPRHLYFERRRLTLAGCLAFVAGFALHMHVGASAFGVPFPIFTGFLYAALVVPMAAVTTYLFPNMRWLIDGVAVSRLCFASWVVGVQGQEIAASAIASATIVVGGAIVLLQLCRWIDITSRRFDASGLFLDFASLARKALAWIDNTAARTAVEDDQQPILTICKEPVSTSRTRSWPAALLVRRQIGWVNKAA